MALLLAFAALPTAVSALPANQNQLRVQTEASRRDGETAFSTLVSWRKGDANLHRANGLIFINGLKSKQPTSDVDIARKAANALNGNINYDAPSERGAIAKSTKGQPEFFISNRDGFDLSQITVRDYSNQTLKFDLPGTSFGEAKVDVAIDLVYSAAVEYVDGFAGSDKEKTEGGTVTLKIDDADPIEIDTTNKSAADIEKELAKAISGADFSSTPIYENYVELKSRNYKPFDGGEIQLRGFAAKTIGIDVNDSGLGVLTKFKFPDVNKPTDVASKMPYIVTALILAVLGYVFYELQIKGKRRP